MPIRVSLRIIAWIQYQRAYLSQDFEQMRCIETQCKTYYIKYMYGNRSGEEQTNVESDLTSA